MWLFSQPHCVNVRASWPAYTRKTQATPFILRHVCDYYVVMFEMVLITNTLEQTAGVAHEV